MASLVSRGTRTLRAMSALPDAWITWEGGEATHLLSSTATAAEKGGEEEEGEEGEDGTEGGDPPS